MAACWKPGGEEVLPALGLTLVAPDELRGHFAGLFAGVPDVTFDIRDHAVDDDLVAIRSVMSGTHRGRYNGLVATRRRFEIDVTDFIRVEGDEIISNHVVADALGTLRQLGVLPPLSSRREAALRLLFNGMATIRRLLPQPRTRSGKDDSRFDPLTAASSSRHPLCVGAPTRQGEGLLETVPRGRADRRVLAA